MSRLRRLVLSGRYFFVTCNLLRSGAVLNEDDFEILARVMQARREEHRLPAPLDLPQEASSLYRIPRYYSVVAKPILGGLHHEYGLERFAA